MNDLREALIERYAEHYSRVNNSFRPGELGAASSASMEMMFGPLLAAIPNGGRILDLGCGTGMLLTWLVKHPLVVPVGVDSSAGQLEIARQGLPNVELIQEDGLAFLEDYTEEFVGIFCFDVLEHIPGNDLLLRWVTAIGGALKPGGFFCCRTPNAANLTGAYSRYMDLTHERSFTSTSLLQLLEVSGFRDFTIIPVRRQSKIGRMRAFVEHQVHLAIFQLCGRQKERVFSSNVHAVAYKGQSNGPPNLSESA